MTRVLCAGLLLTSFAWLACAADVDSRLPAEYRQLVVPEGFASGDARRRGEAAFREYCAVCHGERGNGFGSRREGLQPPPRDLTSRAWQGSLTPRRVFFVIREGLAPSPMPSWKALTETQAWDLAAYVLSLGARP